MSYRTAEPTGRSFHSLQDARFACYRTASPVVRSQASWRARCVGVFASAKGVCLWQGVSRSEVEGWVGILFLKWVGCSIVF